MSKESGTKSILSGDSWGRRFFVLKVCFKLCVVTLQRAQISFITSPERFLAWDAHPSHSLGLRI